MKIFCTILQVFFFYTLCMAQRVPYSEASIDSLVSKFQQKWRIPGLSVAIAKDGKLLYAKGFGYADTAAKEPVTTRSLFRIASCSKTITAIGVMKLIENKQLRLTDKVFGKTGILNDSCYQIIADSNVYRITVKNLLQQTIGWPAIDIIGDNFAAYELRTAIPAGVGDNIIYILRQKHDFTPGTAFRYSDFNYLILGEIISRVSRMDHVDYITSEILHPAGAFTTIPGKSLFSERAPGEVVYYDYYGETAPSALDTTQIVPLSYSFYMKPMISSGGWVSRPIDMVKIILSIDGLAAPRDILNAESIALMATVPENVKGRYGMGMNVTRSNTLLHTGECTWGTSAVWVKTPGNICYAITCNTLPSIAGTEQEKYAALKFYDRDLSGFLQEQLEKMDLFPDIDLFNTESGK